MSGQLQQALLLLPGAPSVVVEALIFLIESLYIVLVFDFDLLAKAEPISACPQPLAILIAAREV